VLGWVMSCCVPVGFERRVREGGKEDSELLAGQRGVGSGSLGLRVCLRM
jgi:hypothetical protein